MRTLKKIIIPGLALVMLFLTSCLNDENVGIEVPDFGSTPYLVDFNEMPNSQGLINRSLVQALDLVETKPFTLRLNLSSPYTLKKDLTITIAVDDAAANEFIADNPTFELLPTAYYSIPTTTLTIPAGEREVEFTVNVATGNITLEDKMLLAISIVDVSEGAEISGNFGTALVAIGIKNFFHGNYDCDISYFHPTAGGTYPDEPYSHRVIRKFVSTIDANTCRVNFGVWSDAAELSINPDNSIEYIRVSGAFGGTGDPNDPTLIPYYDRTNRVIYVYYWYAGSGGNRIFWEVMTFVN
ncbi:MAG: DUF1735 domain-containing protein [Bacteroidales bacterium]|nr:DUF1735 domain-containing protein [Bacteroidales bacterium]